MFFVCGILVYYNVEHQTTLAGAQGNITYMTSFLFAMWHMRFV